MKGHVHHLKPDTHKWSRANYSFRAFTRHDMSHRVLHTDERLEHANDQIPVDISSDVETALAFEQAYKIVDGKVCINS